MNTLRLDPRAHIARIEDGTLDLSALPQHAPASATPAEVSESKKWFVSPYFDLLFVCGFAPWFLCLLAIGVFGATPSVPTMGQTQQSFNLTFLIASLLIGEAHQFTSIIRFLSKKRFWKLNLPLKRISPKDIDLTWSGLCLMTILIMQMAGVPVVAFAIGTVIFLPFILSFLGVFIFPVVLMQHFVAQAKAIGVIYCGQNGYILSKSEHRVLSIAANLLVAAGAVNIAMPFGFTQPFPQPWPFAVNLLAWIIASALLFYFIRSSKKTGKLLPSSAVSVWGNMTLFILLTPFLPSQMLFVWLFVPIFFHASQHWTLAWATAQREAKANGIPVTTVWQKTIEMCRLVLPVQALTLGVLFLPALFGVADGAQPQATLNTLPLDWSLFVFYLHYVADRIVWRARS